MSANKVVRSADNPRFKALRRLAQSSQERRRTGLSVLDGPHLVAAYCEHAGDPAEVVVSDTGRNREELRALLARLRPVEPLVLADALFEKLSSVVTPTGIIAVVRTPRPASAPPRTGSCLMVEDLQDPGNLGSVLRSAAAAGMTHVLLSKHAVHAWSPRVLRAAMGAHFLLAIHEGVDLVAAARAFHGRVIATSQRGARTLFDEDLRGDVALVFGNEGGGISEGLLAAADAVVAIPMPGGAESLNVAAAAAVCLFERVRQMARASSS
jgi:TrmH family RNA methyltransferase